MRFSKTRNDERKVSNLEIMISFLKEHCLFHTKSILRKPPIRLTEWKASKYSLADHICHFTRATASHKGVCVSHWRISQPSVQTNFDDLVGFLSHSFSHLFIQPLVSYTVDILASYTSIPNTKTHCLGKVTKNLVRTISLLPGSLERAFLCNAKVSLNSIQEKIS